METETAAQHAAGGGRPRSPRIHKAILKAAVDLVLERGFRAISMEDIATRAKVGRMTIYRRWCNKAAIIMDAFVARVNPDTLFVPGQNYNESIRLQMRSMARLFRGKDGALIRVLLAESQFDPRLATELHDRWTMPRRKMAIAYFQQGIRDGFLRPEVDPNAMIDILYAPLYYRLQMGTGPLSDAYVDEVFDHAMRGFSKR